MAKNDLLFDKPKLENGGQSQEAIVVTSPGKQPVNAPTVEDIKRIAKGEAETESDKSYTKAESDAKFLSKTDAASTYYTKAESDERYQEKTTMPLVTNMNHGANMEYSADDISGLLNSKLVGIDILANDGYDDYPLFVTGRVTEDENYITINTCVSFGANWQEIFEMWEIKISKSTKVVYFNGSGVSQGVHLVATFKIYKIF